jgi:predicted transcriptional regulator
MARVNVFLKDDVLKAVDAEAAEARMNRSALVQAAILRYLEARRKEREEAAIRGEMEEAVRGMDALAEKLGDWDPVRAIREFRDSRSMRVHEPRQRYARTRSKRRA